MGTFLAFDRHMNVVLSQTEEWSVKVMPNEEGEDEEHTRKRPMGLIFVRGETVTAIVVQNKKKKRHKKPLTEDPTNPTATESAPDQGTKRKRDTLDEAEQMAERASKTIRRG